MAKRKHSKGFIVIPLIMAPLALFVISSVGSMFFSYPPLLTDTDINFNNNSPLTEVPTTDVPSYEKPVPSSSLTPENVREILDQTVNATELEYREESVTEYEGCKMKGESLIRKKNGNTYSKQVSEYFDEESMIACDQQSFLPIYLETYRLGDKILNRQYPDKNFEDVTNNDKMLTATLLKENLPVLYSEYFSIAQILNEQDESGMKVVEVRVEKKPDVELEEYMEPFPSKYTLKIDMKTDRLLSLSIPDEYYQIDGEFSYTTEDIKEPGTDTNSTGGERDMQQMLQDIFSHELFEYSITTENNMFIYDNGLNNFDPEITSSPQIYLNAPDREQGSCYLSTGFPPKPDCDNKEQNVRDYLEEFIEALDSGESIYCEGYATPEGGSFYVKNKDKITFRLTNNGRDPKETLDYTAVTIIDRLNSTYESRIDYDGREYCFEGQVNDSILIENIDVILESLGLE